MQLLLKLTNRTSSAQCAQPSAWLGRHLSVCCSSTSCVSVCPPPPPVGPLGYFQDLVFAHDVAIAFLASIEMCSHCPGFPSCPEQGGDLGLIIQGCPVSSALPLQCRTFVEAPWAMSLGKYRVLAGAGSQARPPPGCTHGQRANGSWAQAGPTLSGKVPFLGLRSVSARTVCCSAFLVSADSVVGSGPGCCLPGGDS